MSYRGFHVLEDKPNNLTLELHETWVDPDKDIWTWKIYVSERDVLRQIGDVEGYSKFSDVLQRAAVEFRRNEERVVRKLQHATYGRTFEELNRLTPSQRVLLEQFALLYNLALVDCNRHLPTFIDQVTKYIRRRTRDVCSLQGSDDFATGCFLYPSGKLVCRCTTKEFVVDFLDPCTPRYVLEAYYGYAKGMAEKVRLPKMQAKIKTFVPLRTLLKRISEETKA